MILCCGEALIDMLPQTGEGDQTSYAPHAGGAVFNTAVALGRLGVPAGFYCALSDDMFGAQLRQVLEESRVDLRYAPAVDRPCTLAFVQLVDGQAHYLFYDVGSALRMMTPDALPALEADVEGLFFGCISLVGEPCGSAFEALMQREEGRRLMVIDPNIRTSFISDETAFRARMSRMIAMADIVKVSDEDLHWLEGEGTVSALAHGILQKGPRLVLVTEGARGAHGYSAHARAFVPANQVRVADTIGAGDTFNAGALDALRQMSALTKEAIGDLDAAGIETVLKRGVDAAAITVSRAGANPPWAHEF
ncbi:MAG: carbohydrate kinase [Pseudomonadota bacterium]